jgi:hypothetical protein
MSKAIYETALNYVSLYGFSVIPLIPNKKIPPFDWKEYQNRLPSESELKEWFLEKNYNIGIITGAVSNLIVIDIDNKNGKNGFDYINGLDFTQIPSVITPHDGRHLYFRYSEGVKTIASEKGIDIRSDGGYVVAPPSVIDGIKYEWYKPIEPDKSNLLSIPKIFLSLDTDTKTHSLKPPKLLAKGTSILIDGETLSHSEGKIFERWRALERDENFIRFIFKFVFRCEPSKNMICVLHAEKHASASVFFSDKAQRFEYKDFHDMKTYSILDLLLTYFGIPVGLVGALRLGLVSFLLRAYNGNAKTEFETYSLLGDYDLRLAKTYLVIASLNEINEPFLSVRSLASMLNLKNITYTNRLLNFLCLIGVLEKYERGERKANGFKLRNLDTSKLKNTLENLNGLDIGKLSKQEALKYFDIQEIEAIYKRKYKV